MELLELLSKRRSIRNFKSENIPEKIELEIIQAAISAPSAGNIQPWEFILIKDEIIKRKIAKAAFHQNFISQAPLVIVVCADTLKASGGYGLRGINLYCIQDTAAAIENMLIYITYKGLGACWVGAFNEESVKEILHIPDHLRPVALIPVGYPDEKPGKPPKRNISSVIHYETFNGK
ncbi:MAG: nitroreductase family protein [Candidatus Odinarchaeia archaeon]